MQILLRSLFQAAQSDNPDLLLSNILSLRQSGLAFLSPEHQDIWEFIGEFSTQHGHAPDVGSIKLHFEQASPNPDVINHLEIIRVLQPVFRGDFQKRLSHLVEQQKVRQVESILKEANQINRIGVKVGKDERILKGPADAIRFVTSMSLDVTRPAAGPKREGEITEDIEYFKNDYIRRRDDPNYGIGQLTGIRQLDETIEGARKGQLWTHAAFTGELKSTLSFNWVYNQAVYYGYDSLTFSLEMSYDQCQRILYVMHSMHPKFAEERIRLGIQKDSAVQESINYSYVRSGRLPPEHEKFFFDVVMEDLKDPANGYGKVHFRGYDVSKKTFTVSDIQATAEALYRENPFSMLVVDHVLLVDSEQRHASTTDRANEVVRHLKKLSETFNLGDGMAILALFQISRQGKMRADKVAGPHKYNLYDLSYSNEIERSSDVVTATYLNPELRKQALALCQFLKTRDDGAPDPFYMSINWSCRRLTYCDKHPAVESGDVERVAKEIESQSFESLMGY